MVARRRGEVSRNQLITTYGVGAIVALEDESFMITGIDQWGVGRADVHEPRLERELRVQGFVSPPATDDGPDIPVVRFPEWYSCPGCKRLAKHSFFATPDRNRCDKCDLPLIPSRFVIVCPRGHIDDFPYFPWFHHSSRPATGKHEMTIDFQGASASLRSIVISCSCGGSPVSMEGAFGQQALRGITGCHGRRPWLRGANETCPELPRTLQRGASNVWFPVPRSALSIPPWSEGAFRALNRYWTVLRHLGKDVLRNVISETHVAEGTPYSIDALVEAAERRKAQEAILVLPTDQSVKAEEYEALTRGKAEVSRDQDFVCVPVEPLDHVTSEWFERVMVVKRLREVRALEFFTRLLPPSPADPPERRARLYDEPTDWLPAIEVNGEGVFFELARAKLTAWECDNRVAARADRINQNYVRRFLEFNTAPTRVITPRLLLIHTLAHAIINQWALDSGYPAASLRERLYVSENMAGLLVYTATMDSAGSLGGIVGRAQMGRLGPGIAEAVERSSWCSADPLCIEADAAGVDSLNLAACHACLLLPEVSCEEMNVLLDRGMLVGTPGDPSLGYFSKLLGTSQHG